MLKFLKAFSVFVGTIIGVGIFGLPYVAMKAGFFVMLSYFLLITGVVIIVHLLFGRVCLETKGLHRFPGYVEEYLGLAWKNVALLILGFGLFGALLAYLIVGGEFLKAFFSPFFGGNSLIYTLIFFSAGAYLIFRGIKSISYIELFLLIVFFTIIVLFFVRALPYIDISYLKNINFEFFALPYGVILFSLYGLSVVPEVKEILKGDKKMFKNVIISGILVSAIVCLFFIFIIFGASGPFTSKEAISGFAQATGNHIIKFGFIFGIIACFTSFIAIGLTLKKILWYDLNLSKNLSWLIACFIPLLLFLAGFRAFIDIIGFTGALAIGGEGIIIVFLYREFLKKKSLPKMNPLAYSLIGFFVLGIVLEIFYFISC